METVSSMTARARVQKALDLTTPDRPPRDLWYPPATGAAFREEIEELSARFPMDIARPPFSPGTSSLQKESALSPVSSYQSVYHPIGEYIDEWGSIWHIMEPGLTGEVKKPVLPDLDDLGLLHVPREHLASMDLGGVDEFCRNTDSFVLSGLAARLFEQVQFIHGTEQVLADLLLERSKMEKLIHTVHQYNLEHITMWLDTNVDAVFLMDDWGSQRDLLISPELWRHLFKPLYREYCDVIHRAGKRVFFHSDGNIEKIIGDFIDIGVDALNAQLFCMDIDTIGKNYRGEMTFWGEIDRQYILPFGSIEEVTRAVNKVDKALGGPEGGVIAQCSWQPNCPPQNIYTVFEQWEKRHKGEIEQ
jgi:uroporphyrinogen decarboxylase